MPTTELLEVRGPVDGERYRGELLAFARRLGAGDDAEDVVQEAFLRALERPPATAPRAWLYRVVLNLLRDRGRRRGRWPALAARVAVEPVDRGVGPAAAAAAADLADRAWRVVDGLPEGPRVAVVLRLRHGAGYGEVGEVLGCSAATARQHFHLGIKAVRNAMEGGGT